MQQDHIWKNITNQISIADIIRKAVRPDEFQSDMVSAINKLVTSNAKIIEAGCFTGITSLLLDDRFDKTLLDINPHAIELAKNAFSAVNKKGLFVVGDMFNMPFPESGFDIVFNAGVLEHFEYADRVKALREYARVLKQNGTIVIAFPNHFSVPYRLVYEYLVKHDRWPYPSELKLYDLRAEVHEAGLEMINRSVTSKNTINYYLSCLPRFRRHLFQAVYKLISYEGYLTIVTIRKSSK